MKNDDNNITKRLDSIISLLIEDANTNKKIGVGRIYFLLHNCGLSPQEIGNMVGRKGKDVSSTLAMYETRAKTKTKSTAKKSSKNIK